MTYIGLSPPNTFTKSTSQTFTGNGSTTAFTLQTRVSSPEDLEVFVSNVQQQPTESYTIGSDGVTMTFSEAPPSGTFYVIYRTVAQQAGTDTGASRLGENNTFTGTQTFNADVSFPDNVKAKFGTGNDLNLYHDGSNSYIDETGTGGLYIRNDNYLSFRTANGSEKKLDLYTNGAVELYHDSQKRFETTSTGATLIGGLVTNTASMYGLDMNGGEVILDNDGDTSITADADDQVDIKVGGTDTLVVKPDVVEIKGSHPDLKLMDTDDNNYGGLFYNNGAINLASDHDATGATGKINFVVDGSTKATILAGGNVGIGTNNPSEQLHIDEGASNSYACMRLEGSNRGGKIDMYQGSTIVSQMYTDQSGNFYIGTSGGYGQVAIDSNVQFSSNNKAPAIKSTTFLTQFADDATRNIVSAFQGLVIITSYNLGLTCIARMEYQNIVQIVSANSLWSNTDTDGKICLLSGTNDYSITLKNRYGSAMDFKVIIVGTYQ